MLRTQVPSRSVSCPRCGAPIGRKCTTSTGNTSHEPHGLRRRKAKMLSQVAQTFDIPPNMLINEEALVSTWLTGEEKAFVSDTLVQAIDQRFRNKLDYDTPIWVLIPKGASHLLSEPVLRILLVNKVHVWDEVEEPEGSNE